MRQYLRSLIIVSLIGFQLLDFLFKESGSVHVFDAAIRGGSNNVGMPHDLIDKVIWRPVAFFSSPAVLLIHFLIAGISEIGKITT